MATLAQLRNDLKALQALAGTRRQIKEWDVPGLGEWRNARARQSLITKITGQPAEIPFDYSKYGHDQAYYEEFDQVAYSYWRDSPADPARDARIRQELADKLVKRINSNPTLTG